MVTTFNIEIGISGAILTKLDGDSRGGAALSVKEVILARNFSRYHIRKCLGSPTSHFYDKLLFGEDYFLYIICQDYRIIGLMDLPITGIT